MNLTEGLSIYANQRPWTTVIFSYHEARRYAIKTTLNHITVDHGQKNDLEAHLFTQQMHSIFELCHDIIYRR